MDNVKPLKNYGAMDAIIVQNQITGRTPSLDDAVHVGIIGALELTNNTTVNTNQYIGKTHSPAFQDDSDGTSALGTPVWGRLVIKGGQYIETNTGKTVTYPNITLDTILFTLSQIHNVVLTSIQGRDYEVVEYIGKASFRVNCKGGIFGGNNNRPVKDINNLKLMLNSNQPIIIESNSFLTEWGISEIVILDKNIPQIAGGYNYQLFEFNAIQNVPVLLAQQQNVS
jgi:hypothetical protein